MRSLPLDYPLRNLFRQPLRTTLTAVACALVGGVLVSTSAFVRSLDDSFRAQGASNVAMLLSTSSQRDLVRSAISPAVADLVAADVPGVVRVHDVPAVSPEIHMGTKVRLGAGGSNDDPTYAAFVRGVTERAFLVHESVTVIEGSPPGTGEVLVGRLVADKLGVSPDAVRPGRKIRFESGTFRIAGTFAAPGTTIESEIWAPLQELKGFAQRDDVSTVFVKMESADGVDDVDVFAARRLDLELMCVPSLEYYSELSAYFEPIRALAWGMALLIGITVIFTGANTLNTSVLDRAAEIATLRAMGFPAGTLARSLFTEALVLSAAGGLVGLSFARFFVTGTSFRIAMGAFALEVDSVAVIIGFAGVLILGVVGTIPAALRIMRMPVAEGIKGV